MKRIIHLFSLILLLSACNQRNKAIVGSNYADSLLAHFSNATAIADNEKEVRFWFDRINPANTGITNESRYAASLITRFGFQGMIADVQKADSLLIKVDSAFGHKEASPLLSLCRHAILTHHFKTADSLLAAAKLIGLRPYESQATSFDVDFELGRMSLARVELETLKVPGDYGYNFRKAKMQHYDGDMDAAILSMQEAAKAAGNDLRLKEAALSNLADLYLHKGDAEKALDAYKTSLSLNSADLHSLMGIGWIAFVHDRNDSLARKIFELAHRCTNAPDPLYKLAKICAEADDSVSAKKYALQFEAQVTQAVYGNMYNKYLVDLYTSILHAPAKAVLVAEMELANRNTPQTNAWYVYALMANGETDKAYTIYRSQVSGKPLEGLELYWMGKLMEQLNKGYNASEYYKEAKRNKYDLDPYMLRDMEDSK